MVSESISGVGGFDVMHQGGARNILLTYTENLFIF